MHLLPRDLAFNPSHSFLMTKCHQLTQCFISGICIHGPQEEERNVVVMKVVLVEM